MSAAVDSVSTMTPEWARETLKALGYKPRRPLTDYLSGEELVSALLALKVLKLAANPPRKHTVSQFIVCNRGGAVVIKTVLSPRVTTPAGLRRI